MKKRTAFLNLWLVCVCTGAAFAADLSESYGVVPAPPVVGERGIWGAIAYSQSDDKHGFFWGADKRDEAEEMAQKHCQRAGGIDCNIVTVFRNHRHWDDDDRSGFPYNHCAALAVGETGGAGDPTWGAKSAATRREAEALSIGVCEASGSRCSIREWVCT